MKLIIPYMDTPAILKNRYYVHLTWFFLLSQRPLQTSTAHFFPHPEVEDTAGIRESGTNLFRNSVVFSFSLCITMRNPLKYALFFYQILWYRLLCRKFPVVLSWLKTRNSKRYPVFLHAWIRAGTLPTDKPLKRALNTGYITHLFKYCFVTFSTMKVVI